MAFLDATIVKSLKSILGLLFFLLLAFISYDQSNISFKYGEGSLSTLSMTVLLLGFFLDYFKGLLSFETLFSLVGLILSQKYHDLLVNLIVVRIQTHFQKTFSLGVLLIYVNTSLNLGINFSFIGYTH